MKIIIFHLSDLHLRYATDPLLARAERIAEAIGSVDAIFDGGVVAVTGDVASNKQKTEALEDSRRLQ